MFFKSQWVLNTLQMWNIASEINGMVVAEAFLFVLSIKPSSSGQKAPWVIQKNTGSHIRIY